MLYWGMNREGQLGDGTTTHRYHPVRVLGLDDAAHIAAGDTFTCAVRRGGAVVCWGHEDWRPLEPEQVPNLPPARRLAASGDLACVVTMRNDGFCWGAERTHPRTKFPPHPVRIELSVNEDSDLAVGSDWACLRGTDLLQCWDGPTATSPPCPPPWSPRVRESPRIAGSVTPNHSQVCEALDTGRVRCWGPDPKAQGLPQCWARVLLPAGEGARHVEGARRMAFGRDEVCTLDAAGRVRCWDDEGGGGDVVLEGVREIASSHHGFTFCAVRGDSTLWCWGAPNDYGEIGDGTRVQAARVAGKSAIWAQAAPMMVQGEPAESPRPPQK